MEIKLVQATENAGKLITDIASICYGREQAKDPEKLLKTLDRLNHNSTFEHAFYTFKISGLSLVAFAQLVRHRHTSLTVRSGRYTDMSSLGYKIPPKVRDKGMKDRFVKHIESSLNIYNDFLSLGIPKEDARFVLPQGMTTEFYITMNLRELLHIYSLRIKPNAQWEIRELLGKMADIVIKHSPELLPLFEARK